MSKNTFDFSTFANGAVAERLNIELQKVLENIADPNTDPKKARKLQMTVTIKADEERDLGLVSIVTKVNLQPAKEIESKIIIDQDASGKVVGAELKSGAKGQMFIDGDGDIADDRGGKVVNIK